MKLLRPSVNAHQVDTESEIISKSGISLRVIHNVLSWNIISSVLYIHMITFLKNTDWIIFFQVHPFLLLNLAYESKGDFHFVYFILLHIPSTCASARHLLGAQ